MKDITVHINSVHGSQMTAKINGFFFIDKNKFRFHAIAFGRIGGHNIGVKISEHTESILIKLGYNIAEVIEKLQRKLIEGKINLPKNIRKEFFAD